MNQDEEQEFHIDDGHSVPVISLYIDQSEEEQRFHDHGHQVPVQVVYAERTDSPGVTEEMGG